MHYIKNTGSQITISEDPQSDGEVTVIPKPINWKIEGTILKLFTDNKNTLDFQLDEIAIESNINLYDSDISTVVIPELSNVLN